MPLPVININNVSMDYFLRGVDAAKPQGVQPSQVPQEGENAQADQNQQAVGKMVSQLDVLLMKAAMSSTKSLDGKTVKDSLQTLVDNKDLPKDLRNRIKGLRNQIVKAAATAAKKLEALDKFTGKELALAIGTDSKYNLKTKQGRAVDAAVKAQSDLSDLLRRVAKIIWNNVDDKDGAEPLDEVNEFISLCDRRMVEIDGLAWQMKNFALHLAEKGENSDPNITAILNAKAKDLLPRQALAMHGTAEALATVNKHIAAQLRPLAEKIDAFRSNPSATIGEAQFNELQHDIATMKAALEDIRKNGVEVKGGRMVVAKDIIKALEAEVGKAEELFNTARKEVSRKVLENYVATTESVLCEDSGYEVTTARDQHREAFTLRTNFLEGMKEIANAAMDDTMKDKDLKRLFSSLVTRADALVEAAKKVEAINEPWADRLNALFRRLKNIKPLLKGFETLVDKVRSGKQTLFSGAEAMSIFKGVVSASSIIEARARGMEDSDVDPANEDDNIVSERLLGTGAAGKVFELTRSDGSLVVFKGETESRTGLSSLLAGGGAHYSTDQRAADLNIASKNAAKALGMGGLIVDYSVGAHKGVFGFYMEKAKGMTAEDMTHGYRSVDGMSANEIKKLPEPQKKQVMADIRRELNRLQWLDLVTGQADRHHGNYFIHVDRKTLKVTVKGIDNDAAYSQYRTGAVTFSFDADHSDKFKEALKEIAKRIDKTNVDKAYEALLNDPGIKKETKKEGEKEVECFTVDASKIENKAISWALVATAGVATLAVPDKIDRETYGALIALKSGPNRDAYLDSIRSRLSEQSFNAAVSRLNDIIDKAEKLAKEGKIVEKDGWINEPEEVPLQTDKIVVKRPDGSQRMLGGKLAERVNKLFCPSIFARDKLDGMFS